MWRADSLEKDPDAGKDWDQEKGTTDDEIWMASLTQWVWVWTNSDWQWRTGKSWALQSMGSQRVRHGLATEQEQHLHPKLYLWDLIWHLSRETELLTSISRKKWFLPMQFNLGAVTRLFPDHCSKVSHTWIFTFLSTYKLWFHYAVV